MKKNIVITAGIVLLIPGVLLAPPYWFGLKAEEAFNERVQLIANKNGLQVARSNFERGWFSSSAETTLRVPGAPIDISAQHTIYHGPFLVGRWLEGDFDVSPQQAQIETRGEFKLTPKQESMPGGVLGFSSDTVVGLDGAGHTRIESPSVSRTTGSGKLEWRGLQGDIHFDAGAQHVKSELRAPGLVFATGEVSDIRLHSNLHEGIAGHYLGETTFEVGTIAVAPMALVRGLRLKAKSSAQGDTLTISAAYEAPEIKILENQYGPARLALEVRKLDAAVLAKFQEEIRALQRSNRPAEQLGLMQMGKMLQLLGELSKKAPELEITELSFRMGADDVRGQAKFVLDGSKSNIAENPLLMLTALAGDLDVSLPPALLKPMLLPLLQADLESYRKRGLLKKEETAHLTPQQISAIMDRALPMYLSRNEFTRRLVADGNRYRLSASLRRGQVTVNGEPVSLPGAGAMLPAMPQ